VTQITGYRTGLALGRFKGQNYLGQEKFS